MVFRPCALEDLGVNNFWQDKHVLVTGHTGFKGSWLTFWLNHLNSKVHGYALKADDSQRLFSQLHLADTMDHYVGDVLNANDLNNRINSVKPDVIFHMAAQSLVRRSYRDPQLTWQTNVMGTINLLEAVRKLKRPCAVVIVTTDKVYENRESTNAYRESDRLGGHDPYSSSKAAAELATSSWRNSFFAKTPEARIASARAGNVVGGGDWAEDRIVPDLVRSLIEKRPLAIRNPHSVRPWQHVLEPLSGYLSLAQNLYESDNVELQSAFNFGPNTSDFRTVRELVDTALRFWPGTWQAIPAVDDLHEAAHLGLNTEKASSVLSWRPRWGFEECIQQTMQWYRQVDAGHSPKQVTLEQIHRYSEA